MFCVPLIAKIKQPKKKKQPKKDFTQLPPTDVSQLPPDVIGHILTFLPIKEAVRTSILSTQWRHHWRSIPQLVFNTNFATIDSTGLPNQHKLVMLDVFQTLISHQGSSINKFVLAIPGMTSCAQVDPLLRQLSTKHVRELSLLLYPSLTIPATKFQLSSLLSLPDLIFLKLQSFELVKPARSVTFSKLTVLHLNNVILPSNFYEALLPVFLVLEELRVLDFLKSSCKRPVFSAPSLKALFFHSNIQSICFKCTPRLSVLSILQVFRYNHSKFDGFFAQNNPDIVAVFAALPALEKLHIGFEFLLFLSEGDVPYQLPATLHNLKVLDAPRISLGRSPEVQVLLCLIRSSPNLQKLTIEHDHDTYHPNSKHIDSLQKLLEPQDGLGVCCLQRLQEFRLENSRGTRVEMDLVRFVLATAPKLKRVFIKRMADVDSDTMVEFVVEVLRYEKISKDVKFIYVPTKRAVSLYR
ncbi:F-box/FBD/LRR-repeat protein At1g13570 [Linum grandiflorum]